MGKHKYLIDSGHGGVKNGVYVSCPNYDPKDQKTWYKMWVHPDGTTIYEGGFNRNVKEKLFVLLDENCIDYFDISPGVEDISLEERVMRADNWYKSHKNSIFISIHGNAYEQNKGSGFEVYTSMGQTKSDKIAEIFVKELEKEFPKQVSRKDLSDGDSDKDANYYVLRKTDCPAILTENFFMSHSKDVKIMLSEEGQCRIANAHFNAIAYIEQNGY